MNKGSYTSQYRTLHVLKEYIKRNSRPPTVDEICARIEAGRDTVWRHIRLLRKEELIFLYSSKLETLRITKAGWEFVEPEPKKKQYKPRVSRQYGDWKPHGKGTMQAINDIVDRARREGTLGWSVEA